MSPPRGRCPAARLAPAIALAAGLVMLAGLPAAGAQSRAAVAPDATMNASIATDPANHENHANPADASGPPAAEVTPRTLDARLGQLDRIGYERPRLALAQLIDLRDQPALAAHSLRIDYAIGRAWGFAGNSDEVQRSADALSERPGGRPLALLLLAEMQDRGGQPVKAGELAQQALSVLEPTCPQAPPQTLGPDCLWRAVFHGLRLVARAQVARGEHAFAESRWKQALALAQAAQDVFLTAQATAQLALTAQALDQPVAAQQWAAQAWQLAQGDVISMVRVRTVEATMAARRNDQRAQLAALEDGLRLARLAEARRDVASLQNNLADAYMHSGQAARAAAEARAALPVALAFRDQRMERTLRHNLSVALVQQRQFEGARREIARVDALARGDGDDLRRALQLRELGEAYAGVGQWRDALRLYHEERALSAENAQRHREASLQQLRLKYDSEAKQRDLELLRRDQALKDQQLGNRRLAKAVGVALAVLLALSLALLGVLLARVRDANRQLKVNQRLLRAQSERDPLTDLANRRHFLAVMDRRAREKFHGALLMVDIDHFKQVNDGHGHAAGDAVICEVARRISHAVRQDDLVVRWGGEEFLVYAPSVGPEQLQRLAQRILFSVGETPVTLPSHADGGTLRVTCSIGFAHAPLPPRQMPLHWEQAVNWADMALYTAKSQGRNRARGIVSVEADEPRALMGIESDFEGACRAGLVQLQTLLGPQSPDDTGASPAPPAAGPMSD